MSSDITDRASPPYTHNDNEHRRSTEPPLEYKIHRYGIFSVAFDPVSWLVPEGIYALHEFIVNLSNPVRFMTEVFWLSPPAFMWFILCQVLHPLMSTVHILTLYRAFGIVERIVQAGFHHVEAELRMLWLCALLSVLCSLCCAIAFEQVLACRRCIGGIMRRHWTPLMVSASLHPESGEAAKRVLPFESEYGLFIPGWDQLYNYTTQVRNVVEVLLHTLAFVCIFLHTNNWVLRVITGVIIIWTSHLQIYPSFWTRGYTFWSHNENYRGLGNLFRTIFSQEYHEYFKKEGITQTVENEYRRKSERVFKSTGDVDTWHLLALDPTGPLLRRIPSFFQPMAFALLVAYPSLAPSAIALMGTFPFALTIVSSGISRLTTLPLGSLAKVRRSIDDFLDFLDAQDCHVSDVRTNRDEKSLPDSFDIDLEQVIVNTNFLLTTDMTYAIYSSPSGSEELSPTFPHHRISCGELVVVVADEQHTQSTLLQSIAGIGAADGVQVSINGIHLSKLDQDVYRKSVVFVDHSDDTLLPGTLHDNLLWTVNLLRAEAGMRPIELSASDYRFCSSILEGVCEGNPRTVLKLEDCDVCVDTGYSYSAGKYALAARRHHERPSVKGWQITKEDRQLISITRAFLKAKYGPTTKLVIFDNAASSFDAVTERRIFEAFAAVASSSNQTLIYSTCRIHGIAEKAKQVLCLRKSDHGPTLHSGDHESLYRDDDAYEALYDAQLLLPVP
ncbi:hypothetical protein BJ165DRAFT_1608016 [Panaeolus papilionaceus]|nr:hypothetical protein BJ165DRAFT_1608016 [Panaeolus papilionaceus]